MTSDLETVSAQTQGISADWSRADGIYDPIDRGRLDHGGLLQVLRKAQPLSVPAPGALRMPRPPAATISRLKKTLTWMSSQNPEDGKPVWMRADGHRRKPVCWRFGISRATAQRRCGKPATVPR